jgi:hypothetical protein
MVHARSALTVLALGTLSFRAPVARAETMLEWAKARGANQAEKFDDDVASAIRRPLPVVTWMRTWGSTGPAISELFADTSRGRERTVDGSWEIATSLIDHSFQPAPFTWGRTWLLTSRLGAGGGTDGVTALAEVEAGAGPLWALSHAGEGVFARLSLRLSEGLTRRSEALVYGLSLPLGFTSSWAEFGLRPELGVIELTDSPGGGPFVLGAYVRTIGRTWHFAVEHDRSVVGDYAHATRVSACGSVAWMSLCSDGWWLATERAQWGRAGLRLGVAWGKEKRERREAPTNPVMSAR